MRGDPLFRLPIRPDNPCRRPVADSAGSSEAPVRSWPSFFHLCDTVTLEMRHFQHAPFIFQGTFHDYSATTFWKQCIGNTRNPYRSCAGFLVDFHHSGLHLYLSTCRDRNKHLRLCPDGNDRTVRNIDVDMYCVVDRVDHNISRLDRYIIPVFK